MATKEECSKLSYEKKMQSDYKDKCGMYDEKELKCIDINSRLQSLKALNGAFALQEFGGQSYVHQSTIDKVQKEFNDNNCTKLIEQYRQGELGGVLAEFSGLDKARIESESIYQRNQRIFFGGLVLIAGVVIFTMFGKKK
jgi:hypothetical protein